MTLEHYPGIGIETRQISAIECRFFSGVAAVAANLQLFADVRCCASNAPNSS